MTATARCSAAADPYRLVATLYAWAISWQITPASLALARADRSVQSAAHSLMNALDDRDPEHALAAETCDQLR
jgi:hypothetical protein